MKFPPTYAKIPSTIPSKVESAADVPTSKLSLNTAHKLHLAHESLVSHWLTIFEILSLGYWMSKALSCCCTSTPPTSPLYIHCWPLLRVFQRGKRAQVNNLFIWFTVTSEFSMPATKGRKLRKPGPSAAHWAKYSRKGRRTAMPDQPEEWTNPASSLPSLGKNIQKDKQAQYFSPMSSLAPAICCSQFF